MHVRHKLFRTHAVAGPMKIVSEKADSDRKVAQFRKNADEKVVTFPEQNDRWHLAELLLEARGERSRTSPQLLRFDVLPTVRVDQFRHCVIELSTHVAAQRPQF